MPVVSIVSIEARLVYIRIGCRSSTRMFDIGRWQNFSFAMRDWWSLSRSDRLGVLNSSSVAMEATSESSKILSLSNSPFGCPSGISEYVSRELSSECIESLSLSESELELSVLKRLAVGGLKYSILPSLSSGADSFGSCSSSLAFGLGLIGWFFHDGVRTRTSPMEFELGHHRWTHGIEHLAIQLSCSDLHSSIGTHCGYIRHGYIFQLVGLPYDDMPWGSSMLNNIHSAILRQFALVAVET